MQNKIREKQYNACGVVINYAEGPDNGPPLLLLHGAGSIWQDWEAVILRFSKGTHLYAPDLRGCGRSGHVQRNYRYLDFAEDIGEFIRLRIRSPVTIIGHSLGAMVAIKVAVDVPQFVAGLILEDPPLYMDEYMENWILYPVFPLSLKLARSGLSEKEMRKVFAEQLDYDEAEAQKMSRSTVRIDPDLIAQMMDKSVWDGFDTDRLLKRLSCPALLLHGEASLGSALRDEDIKRAARYIPEKRIAKIKGAGHGLHFTHADEFNSIVSEFIFGSEMAV